MDKYRKFFCWAMLLSALLLSAPPTWAGDTVDLRKTRIARISLLEGDVSIQHEGTDEWESALVNLPVVAGDLIYTSSNARVELQIHGAFIRLSERTSLEAVELSPQRYRLDLSVGTAAFSLEEGLVREVEVDTPQSSITLKRAGVCRVNVLPSGDTEVVVHKGEAEVLGRGAQFKLREGRRATFHADNPLDVDISSNLITDLFDSWNEERDSLARLNRTSRAYIDSSAYGYGISDLDLYGSWLNVPTYGWAWRPSGLSAGWAPYRVGRWSYCRPWGWTWVSNEPWGWLPYHYGYWVFLPDYNDWFWVPSDFSAVNSWLWWPAPVSWYYVTWNNTNYVCWRPRPAAFQPPSRPDPQPLVPGKPGQPIRHDGGEGSEAPVKGKVVTLGAHRTLDGVTILSETDFVSGSKPITPAHELLDQLEKVRPIAPGAIPVKPERIVQPSLGQRQLPPPEIISRPVLSRSSSGSSHPGVTARREHELIAIPIGKPKQVETPTVIEGGKRKVDPGSAAPVGGRPAATAGNQPGGQSGTGRAHHEPKAEPSHSQHSSGGDAKAAPRSSDSSGAKSGKRP